MSRYHEQNKILSKKSKKRELLFLKEIKKGSLQIFLKAVRCIKLNIAYVSVIQKQPEAVLGYSYMYQQQQYLYQKKLTV